MTSTRSTATIAWDRWGVAHIKGPDEESVFRALGWAQCESHLEELLAQWKLVRGELADVLGESGTQSDAAALAADHLGAARRGLEAASPQARLRLAAVVDGVRNWLLAHPEQAPTWTPPLEDCLPLATLRATTWPWCVADAVAGAMGAPDAPDSAAASQDLGSNWWAVSGDRTADGVGYLLSDPHLPVGGLTYERPAGSPAFPVPGMELLEVSLRCPGLEVTGFVAAGTCLPVMGHNAQLAWGLTTGGPRVSQMGADGIETSYVDGVERCDAQLWRLATANSVTEVVDTWDAGGLFPINLLVADTRGDSWFVRTGRVLRDGPEAITAELVQLRGMPDGWVQNCNSGPDLTAGTATSGLCQAFADDAVNDHPGRHTSRSRRLVELLPHLQGATHEDLLTVALDDVWGDAAAWCTALARVVPDDPLVHFDGRATGESPDARRFLAWREAVCEQGSLAMHERVLAGEPTGEDLQIIQAALPPETGQELGEVFRFGRAGDQPGSNATFLSFPATAATLSTAIQSPLRVFGFAPTGDHRPAVFGGCALRLTRLDPQGVRSWSVALPGLASRPGHPHRDDQWQLVTGRQVRAIAATWVEALADAVHVHDV